MSTEIEHKYTSEIVCPYCGDELGDSWEFGSGRQDIGEVDCPNCEKTFIAYRNIEVTYNTWKKDDDKK